MIIHQRFVDATVEASSRQMHERTEATLWRVRQVQVKLDQLRSGLDRSDFERPTGFLIRRFAGTEAST